MSKLDREVARGAISYPPGIEEVLKKSLRRPPPVVRPSAAPAAPKKLPDYLDEGLIWLWGGK